MELLFFLLGTALLLFVILIIMLLVLAFMPLNSRSMRPPREDLQKIKAQIEDREFV